MKPAVLDLGNAEDIFTNSEPENIFCIAAEGYTTRPRTLELSP